MRKYLLSGILTALLVCLFTLPVTAETIQISDQGKIKIVVFKIGDSNYYVEDDTGIISTTKMDVAPYIKSSRTFVPVRYLSNALGLSDNQIAWDGNTGTVTLTGNKTVNMVIGSKEMQSDGQKIIMDVAPELTNGRTMLLARYVAEGLGFKVDWDASRQLVICYPEENEKPDLNKIIEEIEGKKPIEEPLKPGSVEEGYQAIKDSGKGFTSEDQLDKEMCDYVWNEVIPRTPGTDDRYTVSDAQWAKLKPLMSDINKLRDSEMIDRAPSGYVVNSLAPSRYMVRSFDDGVSWYCYAFVNGNQLAFASIWYDGGYNIRWTSIIIDDIFEGKWGEPEWLW